MKSSQNAKYDAIRGKLVNRESGKAIPDDEPVFVFRAKDPHAVKALRAYKALCKNGNHKAAVQLHINAMVAYQKEHKADLREPDSQKAAEVKALLEAA